MLLTPEKIIEIVADYYNVPITDVMSLLQEADCVKVRQVSMYFIRDKYSMMSLDKIGSLFPGRTGRKDHATVIHSIKTVNNGIDTDPIFRSEIATLDINISSGIFQPEKCNENPILELIKENNNLKREILKLKTEINNLCAEVCLLKAKRNIEKPEVKEPIIKFKSPFAHIDSCTEQGYSGYREHSL
jgi:hypothetical protein